MEVSQKNVRSHTLYTIKGDFFNEATANKSGVTQKVIRSSTLLTVTNIKIVHQTPDGKLYYNVRNGKRFSVVHVNKENSFISEHYYRQNKSKPFLKRLIGRIEIVICS